MATKYIDQRLTTGSNNGSSAANAWRSIQDMQASAANLTAGDVVEFVAGSGPYYEVFNSGKQTPAVAGGTRKTDISFDAATKRISSVSVDFTTLFNTAGAKIRVIGSTSNDRQYTVASASGAGPYVIQLDSTNTLIDEAAGASIKIVMVDGAGTSYVLEQVKSGTAAAPITWKLNGCELSAGIVFDSTKYKWNASATAGFWYLTNLDGTNPSLAQPSSAVFNGVYFTDSAELATNQLTGSGIGLNIALADTADMRLGWGNLDTLGYSTIYVRRDAGIPTAIACSWNQAHYVVSSNYQYHNFTSNADIGIVSYGNRALSGASIRMNATAGKWVASRILARYAGYHGFETSAAGEFVIDHCVSYWSGHRGFNLSATGTMRVFNSIDIGSHLFALIGAPVTDAGLMEVKNCIGIHNNAGFIDQKAKSGATQSVLDEDYNCIFPSLSTPSATIGYVSTIWTTTGPNSYPPSAATSISTAAALVAAGAVDPMFTAVSDLGFDLCDLSLSQDSVLFRKGASGKGHFYQGIDETTPHSAVNPNIGPYTTRQTTIKTARTART